MRSAWLGELCAVLLALSAVQCGATKKDPQPATESTAGTAPTSSAGSGSVGGNSSVAGAGGVAGANSETPSVTERAVRGDRLRPIFLGAGTAKIFVTWYDVKLKEQCSFRRAGDSMERCMLEPRPGTVMFSDEQCTVPLGEVDPADTQQFLEGPSVGAVCDSSPGPGLYRQGAEIKPAQLYRRGTNGQCVDGGAPRAGKVYVTYGEHISPVEFVSATREREKRGERISVNVRVAEDGAREPLDIYDEGVQGLCFARPTKNGPLRCLPADPGSVSQFFDDAECKTSVGVQISCDAPKFIQTRLAPEICDVPEELAFNKVGRLISDDVYERRSDSAQCLLQSAKKNVTYHTLGESVPLTAFAELTASREGTGRLRQEVLRTVTGEFAARRGLYDSELGLECFPKSGEGDEVRCLPEEYVVDTEFSDDKCTKPVIGYTTANCLPRIGQFYRVHVSQQFVSIVSSLDTPEALFRRTSTGCEPTSVSPDLAYYAARLHAVEEFMELGYLFD